LGLIFLAADFLFIFVRSEGFYNEDDIEKRFTPTIVLETLKRGTLPIFMGTIGEQR
jgi:hypothetical protein